LGFSVHAATVASGRDDVGRESLIRYVLRPPLAQERLRVLSNVVVCVELKRPFSDGTWAVDMDPLSLLVRLAATIPPPRFHTVRYSGVLGSASKWRSAIGPNSKPKREAGDAIQSSEDDEPEPRRGSRWRPWAELMKRAFRVDVETCPTCGTPMKLRALVTAAASIRQVPPRRSGSSAGFGAELARGDYDTGPCPPRLLLRHREPRSAPRGGVEGAAAFARRGRVLGGVAR
jgi:hypothetical protein